MEFDSGSLETTADLISRARAGDARAEQDLISRFIPMLQRWAHGRLSGPARDLAETDDLVQVSILRALKRLPHFESRREGAFLAYLRAIAINALKEEHRRGVSREGRDRLMRTQAEAAAQAEEPSESFDPAALEKYEAALEKLPERQREALILRLEFDYSYAQIASAIESPSEDAARMTVKRALLRLTEEMK